MRIAIWAEDYNGVIGEDESIPWDVPEDRKFFRETTLGHPVIMGRTTFDSLPNALDGRTNIVLSRDKGFHPEGVIVARSLQEAWEIAGKEDPNQVFIVGGGSLYAQAFTDVDRLIVTILYLSRHEKPGQVYAPLVDESIWDWNKELSDQGWRSKSGDAKWRVQVWDRKRSMSHN